MRSYTIKMAIIFTSVMFMAIGPALAYINHGMLLTIIEARIPFTEPKSNAEFICNLIVQCVIGQGIFLYVGLELCASMLESTVTIKPQLIRSDLVHTIQQYEEKSITDLELHAKIGNIVKQSNDADK